MKKIAIVGTGGLGRELLGIIESINNVQEEWDFIGFYDDNLSEELVNDYPVIGNIDDINSVDQDLYISIGIGNPIIKERILKKITNSKIIYPTLIHPSSIIYSKKNVSLGMGVVIAANCVLTVNIRLDNFVYINSLSAIAHDTRIGKYSMIMPTVSISAGADIGNKVYVGNGVKIDYSIKIEDESVVKAGTILSK